MTKTNPINAVGRGTIEDVLAGRARWQLFAGDCMDSKTGLAMLADRSVDHVLFDPPYSEGLYSRTRTNKGLGRRPNGTRYAKSELKPDTSALQLAEKRIGSIDLMLRPVAEEAKRVARRWIITFSDQEISHLWRAAYAETYIRTGIWLKLDPMPQVTGDRPAQGFEPLTIAFAGPGRKRWNGGGKAGVWAFGVSKGRARPNHPCPKPLELMLALVRDFTNPGDLIVDPFAGSGTTGVAAIMLGRRFLGWEVDEKFAAQALRRLSGTRVQGELPFFARRAAAKPAPEQKALFGEPEAPAAPAAPAPLAAE